MASSLPIPKYYVSYIQGGSANFSERRLFTAYRDRNDPVLLQELADIVKMGYPSMIARTTIGGFSSFSDFDTKEEAQKYYDTYVKTSPGYLG